MSELKDQPIDQGTRKRTEYDNARRARLALNIDRTDGGVLQIIVDTDMRSSEEEPEIQQNTFLAIVPMVRLPGHDRYDEPPKGALPRPGRLYVFRQGKLWREMTCDGQGNLADVDVAHWRRQAEQGAPADLRPAVGTALSLTLVPMLLNGRFVGNDYHIAYSELPWTWEYIDWMEADSNRVDSRCRMVGPAWSAAVVGGEQWRASQAIPVVVIDKDAKGLRPRDFSVESLMDDPSLFTPALAELPETDWTVKLQRVLEQLAPHEGTEAPQPLPSLAATADVLAEKALRGYPQLIGLMLDDSLFTLRHAIAQIRQTEHYLLALNALIPHLPNGPYAQVLSSTVMQSTDNPLTKFRHHLNLEEVNEAIFEQQRYSARQYMETMLGRLANLVNGQLAPMAQDWLISRDERLLEPYVLLADTLDALGKNPVQSDALCLDSMSGSLRRAIGRLSQSLLDGTHPLTRNMLAGPDGVPEAVTRLRDLAAQGREPDPALMGLSSLLQVVDIDPEDTDLGLVFKNLQALIGDSMEYFSLGVLTHLNRLKTSEVLMEVEFQRMFSPSLAVLDKLSPKWHGLQLMTAEQAQARNFRILGVNSGNLKNGLTRAERTALSRKHYLYGNILDHESRVIGSSSPRQLESQLSNQGRVTFIVGPDDHPEVRKFSAWKTNLNGRIEAVAQTPAMPLVAVACALYNLQAQTEGMRGLLQEGSEGIARYRAGKLSASVDLMVAIGNLTKPVLGRENGLVRYITKPRMELPRLFPQWRANLIEQTGSPKLPFLRALSGVAMIISAGLCTWDAKQAWHQGDREAALAYGVAATGGAAWTAYAVGMAINPFVLAAGATLFIGGSILAGWLIDSDVESLLKNGPFGAHHGEGGLIDGLLGDDSRFSHLSDPSIAYSQLLGVLGKPSVLVARLADWVRDAPLVQRSLLEGIAGQRASKPGACVTMADQPISGDDWVVTLHSPLLAMFGQASLFQLHAIEQLATLPLQGPFNVERVQHRAVEEAKVSALPMDESTVLYVLPKQFHVTQLTPLERHAKKVTHRLRIMAQFHLEPAEGAGQNLILPQPSPKRWQPYHASFRRPPAMNSKANEAPYWQIETMVFAV